MGRWGDWWFTGGYPARRGPQIPEAQLADCLLHHAPAQGTPSTQGFSVIPARRRHRSLSAQPMCESRHRSAPAYRRSSSGPERGPHRAWSARGRLGLIAGLTSTSGCGAVPEEHPQVASLSFAAVLQEPEGSHLASPMALSITRGGDFIITDRFYQRVHFYSPDGTLLRILGRQGRGPGEFEMIGAAVVLADTVVAVVDDSRRTVTMLRLRDGSYLYEVGFEGGGTSTAKVHGDTLTLGLLHPGHQTGLAEVVLGDTVMRYYGTAPRARLEVPALSGIHTLVAHTRSSRGVVVGFSGIDSLFALSPDGSIAAAEHLPPLRRRHLRRSPAETFGRPTPFPDLFAATSFLFDISPLADGRIAVLHMDQDVQDRVISSRPFLTVLSPSFRVDCQDAPITVASEARLVPAFRGDTVYFVTQKIEEGSVRTAVEGYTIDPTRCPRQLRH